MPREACTPTHVLPLPARAVPDISVLVYMYAGVSSSNVIRQICRAGDLLSIYWAYASEGVKAGPYAQAGTADAGMRWLEQGKKKRNR